MDCHFLLQRIFLTQESNPGLPHCRQPLYHLSHQGSLLSYILEVEVQNWFAGLFFPEVMEGSPCAHPSQASRSLVLVHGPCCILKASLS